MYRERRWSLRTQQQGAAILASTRRTSKRQAINWIVTEIAFSAGVPEPLRVFGDIVFFIGLLASVSQKCSCVNKVSKAGLMQVLLLSQEFHLDELVSLEYLLEAYDQVRFLFSACSGVRSTSSYHQGAKM